MWFVTKSEQISSSSRGYGMRKRIVEEFNYKSLSDRINIGRCAINSKMVEGTPRHLKTVRRLLLNRLQRYNVKIYLYGSMATGDASRASDIDVAILPIDSLPDSALSEIREELENSRIPYRVELVDLSKTSDGFSSNVQRMGTLWND